jgi:hypothetical protein
LFSGIGIELQPVIRKKNPAKINMTINRNKELRIKAPHALKEFSGDFNKNAYEFKIL